MTYLTVTLIITNLTETQFSDLQEGYLFPQSQDLCFEPPDDQGRVQVLVHHCFVLDQTDSLGKSGK